MGPIAEVSVLQQGVMCGEKYGSLRTLFSEDARPICGIDDTVFCQRMKATALMEGATKLAERAEQGNALYPHINIRFLSPIL